MIWLINQCILSCVKDIKQRRDISQLNNPLCCAKQYQCTEILNFTGYFIIQIYPKHPFSASWFPQKVLISRQNIHWFYKSVIGYSWSIKPIIGRALTNDSQSSIFCQYQKHFWYRYQYQNNTRTSWAVLRPNKSQCIS